MLTDKRERIVGCIMGGAIGDALGGPFEGKQLSSDFELKGRRVSDDTQLTLATCEAIIQDNGKVIPSTIATRFAHWYQSNRLTGLGASTHKAVSELAAGGHWALVGRKGEHAAGNGAAMRIAPLAFCLDPNQPEDRRLIRDVSRITHHNEEAYAGALAVVLAISAAGDGTWSGETNLLSIVASSLPDTQLRDRCVEIAEIGNVSIGEIGKRLGTSGYVVESVPLSLFAAQKFLTLGFEATMREIICVGGDTDTIASMSGQLIGTLIGSKQLPQHLASQLDDLPFFESIANKFAETIMINFPGEYHGN